MLLQDGDHGRVTLVWDGDHGGVTLVWGPWDAHGGGTTPDGDHSGVTLVWDGDQDTMGTVLLQDGDYGAVTPVWGPWDAQGGGTALDGDHGGTVTLWDGDQDAAEDSTAPGWGPQVDGTTLCQGPHPSGMGTTAGWHHSGPGTSSLRDGDHGRDSMVAGCLGGGTALDGDHAGTATLWDGDQDAAGDGTALGQGPHRSGMGTMVGTARAQGVQGVAPHLMGTMGGTVTLWDGDQDAAGDGTALGRGPHHMGTTGRWHCSRMGTSSLRDGDHGGDSMAAGCPGGGIALDGDHGGTVTLWDGDQDAAGDGTAPG